MQRCASYYCVIKSQLARYFTIVNNEYYDNKMCTDRVTAYTARNINICIQVSADVL